NNDPGSESPQSSEQSSEMATINDGHDEVAEDDDEDSSSEKQIDVVDKLPYTERMDYIIPFTKKHLQNEYWLGLQAHFSYWTSKDVMYHILFHMIRKPISQ
ncbi:hypothetical protein GGI12_004884, partial [Dipsacomyces acuminosporus]